MSGIFGRIFRSGKDKKVAIDPICKMEVDMDNPPGGKSEYQGKTYYFCAPGCKRTFDKEPEKHASAA
jgi:YHS domain-containing protein